MKLEWTTYFIIFIISCESVERENLWGIDIPYPDGLLNHRAPIESMTHWKNANADAEAVVGVSDTKRLNAEVRDTKQFLKKHLDKLPGCTTLNTESSCNLSTIRVLDMAAGYGRVTKDVLLPMGFNFITLVEQKVDYIEKAQEQLRSLSCKCRYIVDTAQNINQRWNIIRKHRRNEFSKKVQLKQKKSTIRFNCDAMASWLYVR